MSSSRVWPRVSAQVLCESRSWPYSFTGIFFGGSTYSCSFVSGGARRAFEREPRSLWRRSRASSRRKSNGIGVGSRFVSGSPRDLNASVFVGTLIFHFRVSSPMPPTFDLISDESTIQVLPSCHGRIAPREFGTCTNFFERCSLVLASASSSSFLEHGNLLFFRLYS